jgi:ssDNA-binding Zn-finger/Zn-ribbon topoisomerase 1
VIVFSERCTLKKVETPNYTVIKRNEVSKKLKPSISEDKEVLTEENISEIYNKLYPYTQVTEEVKVKHVENINNRQTPKAEKEIGKQQEIETKSDVSQKAETESDISTNAETESVASNDENKVVKTEEKFICPRCGNLLVLRTAKRGENVGEKFYGCSSYPKCRYIRKIDE